MSKSLSSQESTSKSTSESSHSTPQQTTSNSERNSAVQAMNGAQKKPPSAKLPFKGVPMHGVIPLPGAVAHTKLTVGGTLTAKKSWKNQPIDRLPIGCIIRWRK
jgi:hypothetical protein